MKECRKHMDDRLKIAHGLINGLTKNNIPIENIFVDPLVQPISMDNTFGVEFLNAIEKNCHGLPGRPHGMWALKYKLWLTRTKIIK